MFEMVFGQRPFGHGMSQERIAKVLDVINSTGIDYSEIYICNVPSETYSIQRMQRVHQTLFDIQYGGSLGYSGCILLPLHSKPKMMRVYSYYPNL